MLDLQRVKILEKSFLEWRGKFTQRKIRRPAAADRLVIDVGQVHHPLDRITARLEMPLEQIFENIGAKISDVRAAVNSRPAGVHLHRTTIRIERTELLDFARIGIKKRIAIPILSSAQRGISKRLSVSPREAARVCEVFAALRSG